MHYVAVYLAIFVALWLAGLATLCRRGRLGRDHAWLCQALGLESEEAQKAAAPVFQFVALTMGGCALLALAPGGNGAAFCYAPL